MEKKQSKPDHSKILNKKESEYKQNSIENLSPREFNLKYEALLRANDKKKSGE